MSTSSPQADAAAQNAVWQAGLAQQLANVATPELKQLIGTLQGDIKGAGASGLLGMDRQVKDSALAQLNQGYGQAQFGSREAIGYGGLRTGEGRLSPGALSSGVMSAATGLERDRQAALRNLNFQSAQTSLQDYNQVLSLLGQGTQTSLGLAQGFSGASNAAIGGLSSASPFGSALGGAASGASLGSVAGWPGAIVGGVVGGVGGYLAGGG